MKKLFVVLGLALILRAVWLGSFPIGLYSDEAAFGYNAYLLLNTGRDEYGRFWPASLESFGDWKPPMQAWLAIPFIKIFGLNEFAVRLPSAILGTATVGVIYFLAKELMIIVTLSNCQIVNKSKLQSLSQDGNNLTIKQFSNVALLSALLLAINPWHIFMSRIAMLVAVEVFFVSLGVLGLLKGRWRVAGGGWQVNWWWVVAAVSFSGAVYSYYGSRVTIPLILSVFTLVYFNELKKMGRELVIPIIAGAILLFPLLIQSIKQPLILTGRARTTSVFFNDNVRLQLWEAHTNAGLKNIPPVISRFFDNKPYYYARDIAGRYLSHFSPVFLFFNGDSHPPFKIPGLGYLHLIDLPFFLIGVMGLMGHMGRKPRLFLILYLLVSPFVASLTFLTPAANRSFNMVIP
ncbi:MAG: glycosyltransferase family 39 protein, partial [Parcubacteria group bacterium]|nr:glycosyltransferase family 39 protein [Parcubacteria group bacterium]